jgi:protein-export membrane protein SecD
MRRHPGLFLSLIIILAIIAGVFVYPKGVGEKVEPWKLGLDLVGGSHLVYQIDLSNVSSTDQSSVIAGLRDVIEKRVNLFGISQPDIYTSQSGNQAQLFVDLAGITNISDAINEIGQTPLLQFETVVTAASTTPSSTASSSPLNALSAASTTQYIPTNLTGQYITGATLTFDPTTNAPTVSISFNSQGATLFQQITAANVGKPLAIFLDGQLIEAPTVQQAISGGQAVISGGFTVASAQQLVERFNAGALPAPITLESQQTISPSLGSNSLDKLIVAGIIGTLLVMLFMIFYYRLLGIFAALALIIYIALTLGVFKLISVTLSLAGLAGFVLTIGTAVDANVLIFERIKEELKRGLPKSSAIEEGFRRAWPSIRDSNTSTIITSIILYFFTSSFVQGFALTLGIGTLVSLFSAITTTRLFLRFFLKDDKTPPKA